MTLNEKLTSVFPLTINKTKPVFSALVANSNKTGTIEKVLTNLVSYMKEWRDITDIYEMSGAAFKKTYSLISFLEMFEGESEEGFKKRLQTLFVRNGDKVWGTPYDIQQMFQAYFDKANVFVVENVDSINKNKVEDFDFDSEELTVWNYSNAEKNKDARFSRGYGVSFGNNGYCSQEINGLKVNTNYHLHFFHNGNIKAVIKSNNTNNYWNGTTWVTQETNINFDSDDWNNSEVFIRTNTATSSIEIKFIGTDKSYLDYVTLYEYQGFPTFKVLVQYVGSSGGQALALAPGNADKPTSEVKNLQLAKYYAGIENQRTAYLTGSSSGFSQQIYEELLSYVTSEGVKAYMEFVTRDI